jgi:membrane-bound lytic murein transglycosylase D
MSLKRFLMMGTVVWAGCAGQGRNQPATLTLIAPRPADAVPARPSEIAIPARPVDTARVADSIRVVADSLRLADSIRADAEGSLRAQALADSLESLEATPESASVEQVFPRLALDPYAGNDRVEYYLKLFTGNARARMGQRLSAGTRYATMIRDKLRAAAIPEEFTYLALIESGYNPHAYSSAAAVGMWQFMSSTARAAGLRVDWWIDERRDPVRSTDAAIRYLNELRDQFGSLYLAAAAYNGGGGRVSRGLSRLSDKLEGTEGDDQFFVLASTSLLKAETKNYVPQLIAAALVGRDPASYGITIDTQPAFAFDSVSVPPATALAAVAKACDTDLSVVMDLNGHVLRGMTAPGTASSWLRVNPGCAEVFADSFAVIERASRLGASTHVAKKGETMNAIAKKTGVSATVLRRYNPKIKSNTAAIAAGTAVLVPTKDAIKAARPVADPAIERWGTASGGSYVVRRGDTLGGIALRNHTTVAALKRINGMRSEKIIAGQRLRVK